MAQEGKIAANWHSCPGLPPGDKKEWVVPDAASQFKPFVFRFSHLC